MKSERAGNRGLARGRTALGGRARGCTRLALLALAASLLPAATTAADGNDDVSDNGKHCSATARATFRACGLTAHADELIERARCFNVSDAAERASCLAEADQAEKEARQLCREQNDARSEICAALGEARYEPDFDPDLFDPDFVHPTNPNPFFPLGIGNRWTYRGGNQSIAIEVLNRTKRIDGVTCVTVNDKVSEGGVVIEDTDDWFAQALNGDVQYCGEQTKEYETFAGDRPRLPELVNIDGSFKAGREGDLSGVIFQGSPIPGQVYRQEFSIANAEDVAQVVSTSYAFGKDRDLDTLVPRRLAELLCSAGDCIVTLEFTPLDPGSVERKYYARGIGFFLETVPETGEVLQLIHCNFDSRCAALPAP